MTNVEISPNDRITNAERLRLRFVIPSCFGIRASSLNYDIFATA